MYLSDPRIILVEPNLDAHDITEHCSSCVLNIEKPQVSGQNTYGVQAQRRELKGLWDGTVVVNLHHDYTGLAPGPEGITRTLWRMLNTDTPWTIHVRPIAEDDISADNPDYIIPVGLSALPAIEGDPGEIAASSITFQVAGVPTRDLGEIV